MHIKNKKTHIFSRKFTLLVQVYFRIAHGEKYVVGCRWRDRISLCMILKPDELYWFTSLTMTVRGRSVARCGQFLFSKTVFLCFSLLFQSFKATYQSEKAPKTRWPDRRHVRNTCTSSRWPRWQRSGPKPSAERRRRCEIQNITREKKNEKTNQTFWIINCLRRFVFFFNYY